MRDINKYILDSSIALEWVFPSKKYAEIVKSVRESLIKSEIQIVSPDFLFFEVANVLYWKKTFQGLDIKNFIDWLIDSPIEFRKIGGMEVKEIIDLMYKYGTTFYDSIYLWLAREERC